MRVYKYTLPLDDYATIRMPRGAQPLSVGMQHDELQLWARVDPGAEMEPRRFRIAGTGHPGAEGKYVGTVLHFGGRLVWHVFDVTPPEPPIPS